jgi:ribosome biogenesis GTPase
MTILQSWGWNEEWQKAWEAITAPGRPTVENDVLDGGAGAHLLAMPGRILSQREDTFTIATEVGLVQAHPAGVLFHRCSEEERPAVGDWVGLESADDGSLVTFVLARRSRFLREAPGGRGVAQIVATNVDSVFVVSPVSELNLNRLERFLVASCAGGAEPTVVLSKGDLVTPEQMLSAVAQVRGLMEGLCVLTTSTPWSAAETIRREFDSIARPGRTYALVGASGAGKSTLLNALVGEDLQVTGEVRDADGKGRHVTSFRELFALPNGALMMDTPGMREFALWADDGGLETVFADVLRFGRQCRFSDCAHQGEPGCAVAGAIGEGALTLRRLENWRSLQAEMGENVTRRSLMQGRRDRSDLRRKKTRDKRFSGRR